MGCEHDRALAGSRRSPAGPPPLVLATSVSSLRLQGRGDLAEDGPRWPIGCTARQLGPLHPPPDRGDLVHGVVVRAVSSEEVPADADGSAEARRP